MLQMRAMPQPNEFIMNFEDIAEVTKESEQVIRQCFSQFRLDEVFLSFNGGKDCTVLLDLTINVLKDIHQKDDIAKDLKVIYMRTKGPFREIESFIEEIEAHYKVKLVVTEGEMKTALENILEGDRRLKACLMGTRRTDPYSQNLKFMQNTDSSWPQVVRVFPILNWSYHQIWSYILQRHVPYCNLYDIGYTSIGSIHNTCPNPSLAYTISGHIAYKPAWLLDDPTMERDGRMTAVNSRGLTDGMGNTLTDVMSESVNGHAHKADKTDSISNALNTA
ncbi:FAD synthase-like isoform X1 [Pieris napi]|uniref:FAD synthase-like isoform X1 n=2 Tax=Pieris napi TaxID=78633 RepID=UPI001FB9DFBB|nr:FAD synthase-like isoform X1 [Pieris napi]